MPYRKQFTGSPWQQGGPPFGMNQMSGGGMGGSGFGFGGGGGGGGGGHMGMGSMDNQFAMAQNMMNSFGRNQGYGSGFGGGMGPMGMNMNYGMGNMSRNMKDRGNRQNNFRNQRKRPMHRSPMGNSRNKRQNYEMNAVQRNRIRKRSRNNKMGRNNYGRQGRNTSAARRRGKPDNQRSKDDEEEKAAEAVECELYNPAEPTDDFSEYEYEDGDEIEEEQVEEEQEGEDKEKEQQQESVVKKELQEENEEETAENKPPEEGDDDNKEEKKSEDDEKKEEKDKENSKNSIQVTIQQGTKGRSVSQDKKQGSSKKPLVCHVCKIVCSTAEKFRNHMNGRGHKMKMETLLVLQRERAQALEARMKASHHMRMIDIRDSSKGGSGKGKKNQNWCTVCECPFVGNFLSHRRTKEHRRKRDKKYPKCRPCRIGFSNPDEYKDHCTTEEHKKKASQFHSFRSQDSDDDFLIVDATGIFEDEDKKRQHEEKVAIAISEQLKDLMEEEKIEEVPDNTNEESESQEVKVEEEKPIGLASVLLLHGYYCKVCFKFFKYESNAKVEHCKLNSHILNNYKKNSNIKASPSEKSEEKELNESLKSEEKELNDTVESEENKIKEEPPESISQDQEDNNNDNFEEQDNAEPEPEPEPKPEPEEQKSVEESNENVEISKAETTETAEEESLQEEGNNKTVEIDDNQEEIKEEKEEPMEVDEKVAENESKCEEEKVKIEEKEEKEESGIVEKEKTGVVTRRTRAARGRNKRKS